MPASLTSRQSASSAARGATIAGKTDAERAQVAVVAADDAYLEHLGYKPEFRRDFSFLGLFSLVQSELAVLPGVAGTIWCGHTYIHAIGSRTRARLAETFCGGPLGTPLDTLVWSG